FVAFNIFIFIFSLDIPFSDCDETSDKTVILSNNKNMLKTISKDLDIKNSGKKDDKAEYKDYDVIIILGKDFKKF
ncbi:Membrane-bound protein LytR, partial [human gut metagenome]